MALIYRVRYPDPRDAERAVRYSWHVDRAEAKRAGRLDNGARIDSFELKLSTRGVIKLLNEVASYGD